jgi:hypothetical protein
MMKTVMKRIPVLERLAKEMQVLSTEEQRMFLGGGTGTQYDPYTTNEFDTLRSAGSWFGGYVEGRDYVDASGFWGGSSGSNGSDSSSGNYGSSGYYGSSGDNGSSGNYPPENGTHVEDGMCTLGAIMKAVYELGMNTTYSEINRELLGYQVINLDGSVQYNMNDTELSSTLSNYFTVGSINSWADITKAIHSGKVVYSEITNGTNVSHSITITSISGDNVRYWDPVDGVYVEINYQDLNIAKNRSFALTSN